MAYALKRPSGADYYEGEYPINVRGFDVVYFKASGKFLDGRTREDAKVAAYVQQCRTDGIRWGLYHFLRPGDPTGQANFFVAVGNRIGWGAGRPVVDVEVDPATVGVSRAAWAQQVKEFIDRVYALTGKRCIVYTSKYFWTFTGSVPPSWAATIDLWAAWYPYQPDDHATLPASVTPPGFRRWAMWQYAENGRSNGHVANDLNLLAGWYATEVGAPPPVNEDLVDSPLPGVTRTRGRRFGSDVLVLAIERSKVAAAGMTVPGRYTAESVAGHIVANGGDFDMTTYVPVGLYIVDGRQYAPQTNWQPALSIDPDGTYAITHLPIPAWGIGDAVALKRYIVQGGAVAPNQSDAWGAKEPRTIYGVKANGDLLILAVRGRSSANAGHTLYEAAATIIEFGAWVAGDGDGGDSTQVRVGSDLFTGTTSRRLVADMVYVVMQDGGTPVDNFKYKAVSATYSMSLRSGTDTTYARKDTAQANEPVYGNALFVATADKQYNGGLVQKAGDIWLHVLQIGNRAVDGWMAIRHLGAQYMVLTDLQPVPPPPGSPAFSLKVDGFKPASGTLEPE